MTLLVGDHVNVHIRWRGGRTQSLALPRPRRVSVVRKTPDEVVTLINALLDTADDRQIVDRLNELGHQNWRGDAFTMSRVRRVRRIYGLKSRYDRLRERGMLTGDEVAGQLGVCTSTVHRLGRAGVLKRHRYAPNERYLYEPPGDVTLVKSKGGRYKGGRYGGRPTRLIAAQPVGQGAS